MSTRSARYPVLEAEVKTILQYLSGHSLDGVDTTASFFDLGFDSLLLTQASQSFRQKFGVKVTFRQLMEELLSIDAVTGYLDQKVVPDKFAAPAAPVAAAPAPVAAAPVERAAEPVFSAPLPSLGEGVSPDLAQRVDRLIKQQLQVMSEQLELLRSGGAAVPASAGVPASSAATNGSAAPAAAVRPPEKKPAAAAPAPVPPTPKYFGPFKPIDRSPGGGLSERQQKHLDKLTQDYLKRTTRSKSYTAKHRKRLADPRTVAGFRQTWKEIVYPIVVKQSSGSRLWDLDNNEYLDVTLGFGTHFFGHAPEFAVRAQQWQLRKGVEIGPQSAIVGKVAELMCEMTGMERAAFCNTGSEAVLAAVRLARTVTGRVKIATMTGAYHGINDEVLVRGTTVNGKPKAIPIAPGIPQHIVDEVIVLEYGAPEALEILKEHAHELAAVLVEPVQSRQPDLQPVEFLKEVRRITEESETALIFDELVTGFRTHPGGCQALFGIKADLATYGKAIGGGMPIGAICGKAMYMDALDGGNWNYGDASFPEIGMTFFAGTFVRHQLAIRSALSVLTRLKHEGPALQADLSARCGRLADALNAYFEANRVPMRMTRFHSIMYFRFQEEFKYSSLLFFHLRLRGLHIWEARPVFLSTVHTDDEVDFIIRVFKQSIEALREGGFIPEPDAGAETKPTAASLTNGTSGGAEGKTLPLTQSQLGLWYQCSLDADAGRAYHESVTLSLTGPLDKKALGVAFQKLVDRHEALRTTVAEDGQSQTVLPQRTFEVIEADYSDLPPEQARAKASQELLALHGETYSDLRGPFLQVRLAKIEPNLHLLFIAFHHLVGNGPSYWIFLDELAALYNEASAGTPANLPPAVPFSEFVEKRQEYDGSEDKRDSEAYWLKQFSSGVPVLELPVDRPRPPEVTYRGERQELVLKPELNAALRKIGADNSSTLFMVLFAAYSLLMHRLSGQDDLILGAPFDSFIRAEAGKRNLFANTTNMMPLRSTLEPGITFLAYLQQIKSMILETSEHQDYFFGNLIRKLKLTRDPSRSPFFTVTFNFETGEFHRKLAGGVALELETKDVPYRSAPGSAMFDFYLNAAERVNGEILAECDHNTAFISAETAKRWLGHYEVLLEGIAATPDAPVEELPLMSAEEQLALIEAFSRPQPAHPVT